MNDDRFSLGKVDKGGVNKPPESPRPNVDVRPQTSRRKLTEGYQPESGSGPGSPPKSSAVNQSRTAQDPHRELEAAAELLRRTRRVSERREREMDDLERDVRRLLATLRSIRVETGRNEPREALYRIKEIVDRAQLRFPQEFLR